MLDDLESGLDDGRANAWAEGGLESENVGAFVSTESDLRWPRARWPSWALAAAAAIPSPPLLLIFLRACAASWKMSRVRFGERRAWSEERYVGGRNCGSMSKAEVDVEVKVGEAGRRMRPEGLCRSADDSGSACTLSSGKRWPSGEA